ncbi:sensor histidine kinase [Cupriavidus lacunae]|uniref:histidine kinase n=1 Tax=Cupriavidus lacunae TaxID=2666307 RepID=A0A370NYB7_9BURK|nr:ATP-binding protein [Cupriavidus lacunae]RDK10574.1 histidine kinase [Cupriavidus lacunae]
MNHSTRSPLGATAAQSAKPAPRRLARLPGSVPLLRPIRVRLSLVFVLFLLLVFGVGAFGINRLSHFHSVSAQISGRWLQSNRILGDLNNYISDYRATEADTLIAVSRTDQRAAERQVTSLDETIATVAARYGKIEHDPAELALYQRFARQWAEYRVLATQVMTLARSNDKAAAIALYHGDSHHAFDEANATLGVLTEHNVAGATEATEHEAQAYLDAWHLIAAAIVVSGCLVIAAVGYLLKAVSNPIAALVERMHRIADNDPRVDIPGAGRQDEIGDIARAVVRFRDNTLELERSKAALAAQTEVLQELLENERRTAELQRNFVSMASHEFRTPLNVIDGHAQRLVRMKEAPGAAVLAERCARIRAAVLRMTNLIDHLLDSSQLLDGSRLKLLRSTDFSLRLLLHEVCEMHRDSWPAPVIEEIVDADAPEIFHGDARLLFQVFSNLLGNAIKYSPERSPVTVHMSGNAQAVCISVTDRGIGIPEKDLDHLFERYVRGENVAGTVGAGVGLYLVKLAVSLHQGEVSVTTRQGQGSCFVVRLPRLATAS